MNYSKLEDKKKETFVTETEKKLQEAKKNKSKLRIIMYVHCSKVNFRKPPYVLYIP